jgi:hypothetical protein
MLLNKPTLTSAFQRTKEPEKPPKKEKIYNPAASRGRRGKRGLTVYLDPVAHAELKSVAEDQEKRLEDLLKEGINVVLQRYGKKPIA